MLMDAYGREGGVKNPQNHAYVIYGCPLIQVCLAQSHADSASRALNVMIF